MLSLFLGYSTTNYSLDTPQNLAILLHTSLYNMYFTKSLYTKLRYTTLHYNMLCILSNTTDSSVIMSANRILYRLRRLERFGMSVPDVNIISQSTHIHT